MKGSYVEFSFVEKLHARITEVSPANPGETLNDAVERLIAERAELAAAIAERAHYGDTMSAKLGQCENERDALRDAATKFANTMAALSPRWTSEMAKAWTELFAVIDK